MATEPVLGENVLFLRRELLAAGYTDRDVRTALRSGTWTRVRTGAYSPTSHWEGLDPDARHLLSADACLRQIGDGIALSHWTALVARGVVPDGVDLETVQLLRLDDGAARSEAGARHHRVRDPSAVPVERIRGRRLVLAGYAVRQTATSLDQKRTLGLLDHAYRLDLTDHTDQRRWEGEAERWPGAARFRLVVPLADRRVESYGESYVRWICHRFGLPIPEPQVEVVDVNGLAGRADFSWLDGRLLGEFDGKVKYGRFLRPGERPEDVAMRERRREGRLLDTGSAVIRFQWDDVLDRNEERTARRIEARLKQAAALPRPSWSH